jgi:hypothetical protein
MAAKIHALSFTQSSSLSITRQTLFHSIQNIFPIFNNTLNIMSTDSQNMRHDQSFTKVHLRSFRTIAPSSIAVKVHPGAPAKRLPSQITHQTSFQQIRREFAAVNGMPDVIPAISQEVHHRQ